MVTKNEVYDAADAVRSTGELVAQSSVRAALFEQTGRRPSTRDIGPLLLEWKAERNYAPPLERGGVPEKVKTALEKATATLWSAAQAEAHLIHDVDRERHEATLQDERGLRSETLAMADGLQAQVEGLQTIEADLRARIAGLEAEIAEARRHIQDVRANHFWDRVVQDIYALLPEQGALRVTEIMDRLGADLAEEARTHVEGWSVKTIRKKIETRIFHHRLFARSDRGTYRRRRPEDDFPGLAPNT